MLLALFYIFITIWKIFLKIAADAFSGFINLFAISISTCASSILAWSECTFASAAHVRSDPWEPHTSLHKGKTAIGITSPGCPRVQDWTSHYIQPQTSRWSWQKWREKGNEIKWSLKKFKTPELLLFGRWLVHSHTDCRVLGTRTCLAALRPPWSLLGFPTVHASRAAASTLGAARLQRRLADYTQDIDFQRLVIWLNQARFSKVYQMACCWPVWQHLNNLSFFLFKETTLFIVFCNPSLGNGWTLQHE